MPEFRSQYRKLDVEVVHYKTLDELKKDFEVGRIGEEDLYVIDSALEDEPDGHLREFGYTIPTLHDLGIRYEHMMPGSGAGGGRHNNQFFENYLEGQGRAIGWHQMDLKEMGLTGDPLRVVDRILEYYKDLHPKVGLEVELVTSGESLMPLR